MTVAAAAVLPAALLEDDDLLQPVLRDHRRGDRGIGHDRGTDRQIAIDAHGEHIGEGDRSAGDGVQFLNFQDRVGRNAILLSAGADDSEHRTKLSRHYKWAAQSVTTPWRPERRVIAAAPAESTTKTSENLRTVSNLLMSPPI